MLYFLYLMISMSFRFRKKMDILITNKSNYKTPELLRSALLVWLAHICVLDRFVRKILTPFTLF